MSDLDDAIAGASGEDLAPARSRIDEIRQRRAQGRKPLFVPIPEWDGDVVVQYGKVSKKKLAAAAKSKGTMSQVDLLVAACVEVFVLDEDGERCPARDPKVGGDGQPEPIRFDGRLAKLFALDDSTPRGVLLRMYGDDLAIAAHAQRVIDWQTGKSLEEADLEEVEDLAGEADAAT